MWWRSIFALNCRTNKHPLTSALHFLRNVKTPETCSLGIPSPQDTATVSLGTTGFLGVLFPPASPFPWGWGGKNIQQQRPGRQASGVIFRSREGLSVENKMVFLITSSCFWLSPSPESPEQLQHTRHQKSQTLFQETSRKAAQTPEEL